MSSSRLREALAIGLLAVLLVAIAVVSRSVVFRAAPSVDGRTYIEMTRGFADHGLPYLDNGPSSEVPEMRARWNVQRGGHLWGVYPPLFPRLASFALRAGGMRLVARANAACSLALIAFGAFALCRRLTRDSLAGVAAAYATLFGTLVACLSFGVDSFGLVTGLTTWTCYFGLRACDEGRRRWAVAAGLAGAAATASHLLALLVLAGTLGVLAVVRSGAEAPLLARLGERVPLLAPWLPSRGSLARAVAGSISAVVGLAPVAWLNRMRFGSPSPATYGSCEWKACVTEQLREMTLGKSIEYAVPIFIWAAGLVVIAWAARRSRWRWLIVTGVAAVVFVVWPALRRHGLAVMASTVGYLVDNAAFDVPPFWKAPDGLGNLFGPFVVKSMLQCSPFLALAAVAPWVLPERPQRVAAVALPPLALLVLLGLRGNLPLVHALGFPFLNMRYLAPAIPVLVVLAVAVARHVRVGVVGWVALALTCGAATFYLWDGDDGPLLRRVLVLRLTVFVGIGAAILAVLRRRFASVGPPCSLLAGMAFGLGAAVSVAIDDVAVWRLKTAQEELLVRVERQVPQRFALVGWPPQLDPVLSLRASHDIEYIDLYEAEDWSSFRAMIDRWEADGRPVFTVFPAEKSVASPWKDVWWEPVDPSIALFLVHHGEPTP